MKDPKNREFMAVLYRLIEKYEEAPEHLYASEATAYFKGALADIDEQYETYRGNAFAEAFFLALYGAIERQWKAKNPHELLDDDTEQTTILG